MARVHGSAAIVCLVTDRHQLGARMVRTADAPACVIEQVAAAAAAGVDLVHLRELDLPAPELLELASACARATQGTAARVVVNDRVDVAVAAGAAGVHLRGDSVASAAVRAIAPDGFVIGRSIHGISEAIDEDRRGASDYLVLGTVFPTASKATGESVLGAAAIRRVVGAVRAPVLGIGGVTDATLPALAASGAAGFAAIGWFIDAFLGVGAGGALADRVARARRLFDTSRSIS